MRDYPEGSNLFTKKASPCSICSWQQQGFSDGILHQSSGEDLNTLTGLHGMPCYLHAITIWFKMMEFREEKRFHISMVEERGVAFSHKIFLLGL
jgi:hypothetical protein